MNTKARDFVKALCKDNDSALGHFKGFQISSPSRVTTLIDGLRNGWSQAAGIARRFAQFLHEHIYESSSEHKCVNESPDAPDQTSPEKRFTEPWKCIKFVIDIFDETIAGLPV